MFQMRPVSITLTNITVAHKGDNHIPYSIRKSLLRVRAGLKHIRVVRGSQWERDKRY